MKNKFYIILFMFLSQSLLAENIQIQSKNITLDKNKEITIFEKQVLVKTEDNYEITAEFAEYDKKKGLIKLKKDIKAKDGKNNIIESNNAEYYEKTKTLKSFGNTKIITSESYIVESQDITFDNKNSLIFSNKKTIIIDLENNKISLDNFEYSTINNIFKSIGEIKIEDNKNNDYEFSQIYIDTKKKEILGSDIKAYLNDEDFKIHSDNKPRVFANTLKIDDQKTAFDKSIFTFCDYRENDKCPPWTIQSSKMVHDNKKKTIYYDNAVIKVYDIPIFYLPKLSHPDPSVERRSGFLPPSFSDSKNLGFGFSVPYFLAIDKDKNFTFETKLYVDENPLFLGEYHQAFKNSYFYADFGYTEGYKKNTLKKKAGEKSHFFSKFVKSFKGRNNSENILSFSVQDTSNDKYLKLYKIKSNLVDYNKDTLESSFNFTHENDQIFMANIEFLSGGKLVFNIDTLHVQYPKEMDLKKDLSEVLKVIGYFAADEIIDFAENNDGDHNIGHLFGRNSKEICAIDFDEIKQATIDSLKDDIFDSVADAGGTVERAQEIFKEIRFAYDRVVVGRTTDNPHSWDKSVSYAVRTGAQLKYLGGAFFATLAELAIIMMNHGIGRTMFTLYEAMTDAKDHAITLIDRNNLVNWNPN